MTNRSSDERGKTYRVSLDESGHNTTSGLDTSGKRSDIEQEDILSLLRSITAQDSGLDSSAVGDSLVGVDALVGLFAVEEVGDELDNTRNTSGTTDEDDFVDVRLVDLGIPENLLDGLESATEKVLAEFLESSTGEGSVEVDTLEEGVDLDGGLGGGGERSLGAFAGRS